MECAVGRLGRLGAPDLAQSLHWPVRPETVGSIRWDPMENGTEQSSVSGPDRVDVSLPDTAGVDGNARLTGLIAVVLLVALAVEGATLLDVGHWLSVHAFIGMLVIPVVAVKIGSTGYRMVRYYLGDEGYRHRGPPPWVLRVLGPLVVISTVSLLASGVALIALDRGHDPWVADLHRASFIVWFAVMVIHVLGHLLETRRLAVADLPSSTQPRVRGASIRASVVVLSIVAGVVLGLATVSWVDGWDRGRARPPAVGLEH
jgi:hypothetical protein